MTAISLDQIGPDCVIRVRLQNRIGFETTQLTVTLGLVARSGQVAEAVFAADVLPHEGSVTREAKIERLTCTEVKELQFRGASCRLAGPDAEGYVYDRLVFYGFSDVPGVEGVFPPTD